MDRIQPPRRTAAISRRGLRPQLPTIPSQLINQNARTGNRPETTPACFVPQVARMPSNGCASSIAAGRTGIATSSSTRTTI
jgi:hypothetical protein